MIILGGVEGMDLAPWRRQKDTSEFFVVLVTICAEETVLELPHRIPKDAGGALARAAPLTHSVLITQRNIYISNN